MKFTVYLTNGEQLTFDNHWFQIGRSGDLEVNHEQTMRLELVIAHGQWTHVKRT